MYLFQDQSVIITKQLKRATFMDYYSSFILTPTNQQYQIN